MRKKVMKKGDKEKKTKEADDRTRRECCDSYIFYKKKLFIPNFCYDDFLLFLCLDYVY